MSNETMLTGFSSHEEGFGLTINVSGNVLSFEAGSLFKQVMQDQKITDNGKTVGERNREHLHNKLDTWIEAQL